MRFDLKTHETLALVVGLVGLIEQEAVRLLFQVEPSSVISGACVSMVLASVGVSLARGMSRGGGDSP